MNRERVTVLAKVLQAKLKATMIEFIDGIPDEADEVEIGNAARWSFARMFMYSMFSADCRPTNDELDELQKKALNWAHAEISAGRN